MKMMTCCIKCNCGIYVEIDEEFFTGKKLTCPNNHEFYFFPDSPKYPFLFQLSIRAFRNGYYAEAFQTLYTGFEAFKEEFVGIHYFSMTKDINKVYSLMKMINRSEKIDGAFTLAYAESFKKIPEKMPMKLVERRNKIIHSGEFPSKEVIIKTGNWIFSFVLEVLKEFGIKYEKEFDMSNLSFTALQTNKNIENKGLSLDDFDITFIRTSFAITAITPNIIIKESIKNPYEYFIEDSDFSRSFDNIFTN